VENKAAIQEKIRRLGELVGALDAAPGSNGNVAARELMQLLMEVHGAGLERILEIIDESGAAGEEIIRKAGRDPIVRPLLLLYTLHPEPLEMRVMKALELAEPRLRKLQSEVELMEIRDGAVQLRVRTSGHACGSTGKSAQLVVEECIFDLAPDVESLEILGNPEDVSAGFVSLESLLKQTSESQAIAARATELCGAD